MKLRVYFSLPPGITGLCLERKDDWPCSGSVATVPKEESCPRHLTHQAVFKITVGMTSF